MVEINKKCEKDLKVFESFEEFEDNIINDEYNRCYIDGYEIGIYLNDANEYVRNVIREEKEYDVLLYVSHISDDLRTFWDSFEYLDCTENENIFGTNYEHFCHLFTQLIEMGRLSS